MGKGQKRNLKQDPIHDRYQNVTVVLRESTGRPGTPHSFFHSSYSVSIETEYEDSTKKSKTSTTTTTTSTKETLATGNHLTVHRHANGLCIVTLDTPIPPLSSIKYLVQPGSECSTAERRKRLSKLAKGQCATAVDGAVTPTTPLMELTDTNGAVTIVMAGVWGILIEINQNMSPALLERDPLLDGYLAVILPTGVFPLLTTRNEQSNHIAQVNVVKKESEVESTKPMKCP